SYALSAAGSLMLSAATELWHFQLAAGLLFVAWCATSSISSALASTLLAPAALDRGLPLLRATDRVAGMAAFVGAGYLSYTLGDALAFRIAALLSTLAIPLLLLRVRQRRPVSRVDRNMPASPGGRAGGHPRRRLGDGAYL
ncbi:MAG: hypothetical protein M3380_10395, partial [Chloroflexota bacterium]|nr:hypothetical protein [Chloroflexota bacterium]